MSKEPIKLTETPDLLFEDLSKIVKSFELDIIEKPMLEDNSYLEFSFWNKRQNDEGRYAFLGDPEKRFSGTIFYHVENRKMYVLARENRIPLEVVIGVSDYLEKKFEAKIILDTTFSPEYFARFFS
jgi:hypothetical protein